MGQRTSIMIMGLNDDQATTNILNSFNEGKGGFNLINPDTFGIERLVNNIHTGRFYGFIASDFLDMLKQIEKIYPRYDWMHIQVAVMDERHDYWSIYFANELDESHFGDTKERYF